MSDVVRHNLDTHRVVTVCECEAEATISLPDSGLSYQRCACGRIWYSDGQALRMYEPKLWRRAREAGN